MTNDAFGSVFLPILRELRDFLGDIVVIGGWVPEVHRRFGASGEWSVEPLRTTEVDLLMGNLGAGGSSDELANALRDAGFRPLGNEDPSAVWERDVAAGERVEFFIEHSGPFESLGEVHPLEPGTQLGGLALRDMSVLREHAVSLPVPLNEGEVALLRVPALGVYVIHKAATFFRRPDLEKRAKDLHYVVDVMQSGEEVVTSVADEIARFCTEGGAVAGLARQARNQLGVIIAADPGGSLRQRLASGLAVRHGETDRQGDARAMGFLADLMDLIPEDCGDE
jgi:Nucleotidyltransferase